jgi:class 3 adenylate cyclase
MDRARPRQVLVTAEVIEAAGTPDLRFEEVGAFTLKGVAEPVHLAAASRGSEGSAVR